MFKVLIIDDEPIIRKGLKNIINWKQFDCEVCGEACDGTEGKELVAKVLPDIVITDIRMPETDGLAMIRDIKNLIPGSKIIILTGYRDFDYAQEALKLGTFDFILKPSKIEELTAVISRAVKELRFQKARAEEIEKLKKLFEQNIPVLREKLLYDVVYGINTDEEDIMSKAELFNIRIKTFVFIAVETDSSEEEGKEPNQYERHLYHFGIVNAFHEIFCDTFDVLHLSLNERRIGFIMQPYVNAGGYEDIIDRKCLHLQEMIQNCFGFTVTIAVSSAGEGIMQLPMKLLECQKALEHKFYIGSNSIIFHNDVNAFFMYEDYSMLEKYQKSLLEGIKTGNERQVKLKLSDIYNFIMSHGSKGVEYFKNFYLSTILSINNIRMSVAAADNDRKIENRDYCSMYKMISECGSPRELNGLLEEIALNVTNKVNNYNKKSIKLVLRKAMDYLKEHYGEQVTLNDVAEHTYVSTYYLSRLFKKELGQNFVDYLNEIRVEKAKELLKDIRYKTYEVAEMVGIPDAHYFSRLFKKYEGVTPTEYRDSNK